MTQRYEKTFEFEVGPDELLSILTDPAFQQEREKANGALEVRVEELERTAHKLRYVVHTTTHARGLTGVDKNKTEQAQNTYAWDLDNRVGKWTWKGPHGDKARVWGSSRIQPANDHARLTNDFNVEVKVPLVGGKIEKAVMKEVPAGFERYEQVVRSFIEKRKA